MEDKKYLREDLDKKYLRDELDVVEPKQPAKSVHDQPACKCSRCGRIGWGVEGEKCNACGFCTGTMERS